MQEHNTAREVLNAIDDFLSDPDIEESEQKALWDVLTALRGPEGKKDCPTKKKVKENITGPIRAAAFPRTAFQTINSRPNRSVMTLSRSVDMKDCKPGHFRFHALRAAEALRLTINNG